MQFHDTIELCLQAKVQHEPYLEVRRPKVVAHLTLYSWMQINR